MEIQLRIFGISHDNELSHIILGSNICGVKKFFKKSILETKNQALLLHVGLRYFSLAVCDF